MLIELLKDLFVEVFGIIFQKVLDNNRNISSPKEQNTKDIIEPIKRIEVVYKYEQSPQRMDVESDFGIILVVVLGIVYPFIKYQDVISQVLMCSIFMLEIMIMFIVEYVIRRGWKFNDETQSLVIFNMLSSLLSLIILVLMKTPLFFDRYSQSEMLDYIDECGVVKLLFDDSSLLMYIISQMGAVLFLVIFIVKLMLSNISLLALIRIKVTGKERGFWVFIYNKIGNSCRRITKYIKESCFMLVISFLLMSGAFVKFIELIQNIGTKW